jgi:hypothetical protein
MVLHDISDDSKLIEVTSTTLGTERLLERDLYVIDVVAVPGCAEEFVTKSQNQDILDHLLAQVMINTENLLLMPVGLQSLLQLPRTFKILSKWLLDLYF